MSATFQSIFRRYTYISENEKEHLHHLNLVLQKLAINKVSVNFQKSSFNQKEVNYLGFQINKEGIKADSSRVTEFTEKLTKVGKITRRKLKYIIGFIKWFRPFIKNLSFKIAKINAKTIKDEILEKTEKDNEVVITIIEEIKNYTALTIPDTTQPFILEMDASDAAIGIILRQTHGIVGMFSKTLSPK